MALSVSSFENSGQDPMTLPLDGSVGFVSNEGLGFEKNGDLTSDLEGFTRFSLNPFSIDVAFALEKRWVIELSFMSLALSGVQ